jgi:hypothetical protein
VILWRAGLRVQEALALAEADRDRSLRTSVPTIELSPPHDAGGNEPQKPA